MLDPSRVHRWVTAAAMSLVLFGPASHATAVAPAQGDPASFVATVGRQVVSILADQELEADQRSRRFRDIFAGALDLDGMARRALGRHWRIASDAQRERYIALFRDYFVDLIAVALGGYGVETFAVLRQERVRENESLVVARLEPRYGPPFNISFRVRQTRERLRIVDATIAGVSLIVIKRSEFDSVIRHQGLPELLRRLGDNQAGMPPPRVGPSDNFAARSAMAQSSLAQSSLAPIGGDQANGDDASDDLDSTEPSVDGRSTEFNATSSFNAASNTDGRSNRHGADANRAESMGEFRKTERLYKEILEITENTEGSDQLRVAEIRMAIANLYYRQNKLTEAEQYDRRAIKILETKYGNADHRYARALNNLAEVLNRQGRYSDAEDLYKRALTIFYSKLGPNHPYVYQTVTRLRQLYQKRFEYKGARPSTDQSADDKDQDRVARLSSAAPSAANSVVSDRESSTKTTGPTFQISRKARR